MNHFGDEYALEVYTIIDVSKENVTRADLITSIRAILSQFVTMLSGSIVKAAFSKYMGWRSCGNQSRQSKSKTNGGKSKCVSCDTSLYYANACPNKVCSRFGDKGTLPSPVPNLPRPKLRTRLPQMMGRRALRCFGVQRLREYSRFRQRM